MVVRQYRSKKYYNNISTAKVGSEIHSCYTNRGTDDEYEFEIIDATIVYIIIIIILFYCIYYIYYILLYIACYK